MISRWKKWRSYLHPVHLETVDSEINEVLELYLVDNRLRLTTLNAIYSYDDKYYNFLSTFKYVGLPREGSEVLLLGFGLGSIPYMLENKFHQKYHYTAVEKDESMLYLFSRYQQSRIRSHIEIHQADAVEFMQSQDKKYDLICVDVFIGEYVPSHLKTPEFLEDLKSALKEGGMVLWNLLYADKDHRKEAHQFLFSIFRPAFPKARSHEVMGNVILIGKNE